jgi:hypothetical protein
LSCANKFERNRILNFARITRQKLCTKQKENVAEASDQKDFSKKPSEIRMIFARHQAKRQRRPEAEAHRAVSKLIEPHDAKERIENRSVS